MRKIFNDLVVVSGDKIGSKDEVMISHADFDTFFAQFFHMLFTIVIFDENRPHILWISCNWLNERIGTFSNEIVVCTVKSGDMIYSRNFANGFTIIVSAFPLTTFASTCVAIFLCECSKNIKLNKVFEKKL